MKRTSWEEIKERVELKLGEAIDKDPFTILANEAIMDLNEVAYIEAPVKRYLSEDIQTDDHIFAITLEELLNQFQRNETTGDIALDLPFEYNIGYNEIEMSLDYKYITLRETDSFDGVADVVIVNITKNDMDDIIAGKDLARKEITIIKKSMRLKDEKNTFDNELIIQLPQNFSSMIKLEAYDERGVVWKCQPTSINSFDIEAEDRNLKGSNIIYYVHGMEVHVFTAIKINEFRLYFARRMTPVDRNVAFTIQYVELEQNFENMLTFLIAHKWLENFVGTEDSETNNMFQKYQTLKQEYMLKNLPKRTKRRQSNISIK